MSKQRQARPKTTTIFPLTIYLLAAPLLAGLASCGGGGGGGTSSPPPSNPVPSITSLSPSSAIMGAAAQTLTINGTNFISSATVTYNSVAHTATYASSTQLTIPLSASDQATAGAYAVIVTNPSPGGGASNSINFTVDNPVPTISSLSPSSATAGAAAQTLTINGTDFVSASTVTYNSAAHPAAIKSSTQLTISLSAGDQATAGSYAVVVTNPSPGGGPSNSLDFIVNKQANNPVPSIGSLSPSSLTVGATPQNVRINGTGFLSNSTVTFNGIVGASTFVSPSQLTIALTSSDLATAGSFPVIVTNPTPGGGTSNAADFTVSAETAGSVTISPMSATVPEKGAQTFTASVAESSDGVVWTVQEGPAGGTIAEPTSTSAVYLPPITTGIFHIVATSLDDSAQSSSATVTVVPAMTLAVLHSFGSAPGDGELPFAGLIQATDGNFYGTTEVDGASGYGTVFRVDTSGNETVLHSFSGVDGQSPDAGLTQASNGNFYGTTTNGGEVFDGNVFEMDAMGDETLLFSFSGADGKMPYAGLIQASDGNFYGTTEYGGTSANGTVFKMDSSGDLTVLHSFSSSIDGAHPQTGLIQASDGNFYGTAS